MKFYPLEKIVFASDCPFDPEKGTMYIRETIAHDRRAGLDEGSSATRCITRTWSGSRGSGSCNTSFFPLSRLRGEGG